MCAAEKAAAEGSAVIDPAHFDSAFLPDSAILGPKEYDEACYGRHRTCHQRPRKKSRLTPITAGEGGGLNSTVHDEGVDLSRLGRDDDPDDFNRIDQLDISFLSGDSAP
ncbi:hypothetical protein E4U52_005059 [Claviceps spartinae]|nr:hypothetical protein E4U52_005059 [Claviceps spartinae]